MYNLERIKGMNILLNQTTHYKRLWHCLRPVLTLFFKNYKIFQFLFDLASNLFTSYYTFWFNFINFSKILCWEEQAFQHANFLFISCMIDIYEAESVRIMNSKFKENSVNEKLWYFLQTLVFLISLLKKKHVVCSNH